MTISAKVVADSVSKEGKRITTLQLMYPRFIHSEFMTHRVFSRNASSSRAIPVAKMLEAVRNNPAMPIHWGKNVAGMQAHEEHNAIVTLHMRDTKVVADMSAREAWEAAAWRAAEVAQAMSKAGYHKQVVNRLLEPFQHIHVVVTATEFDNFFALRDHEDAQPEIHELAIQMKIAMAGSIPWLLKTGKWHLPYVFADEIADKKNFIRNLIKVSAARCARVSYLNHDGSNPSIEEDLKLYKRLVGGVPLHASPIEHQATPDKLRQDGMTDAYWIQPGLHGNFVGWKQYRKYVECGFNS